MSDITLPTGQRSTLMTPVDINGTVINGAPPTILGTFRAINNGTGYSINDIIVLRQVGSNAPQYYNATTNAVIATPLAADLGNVSATNVTVSSALPSGSNTIGSIANTSFGISGTLPAFASTPTFNIGTAPNLTITNTSFTANAGTNLNTSALALESGGNLAGINSKLPALSNGKIPVEVGSLNVTVGNASLEIANDVGNPIPVSDAGGSITVDGSVSISNFPATQVVNTGLTQPLTDAQLRNTPISVIGTFWQTTQPISATALPLPSGAAIAAKQPALGIAGTASTDVITVQGIAGGVAQPVSIATLPALAAGTNAIGSITNTTFAATQSGAWNVNNISGTISLPTGAATSANQATGNSSLASIDGKLPSLGQGLSSASIPVVLPASQITALTSPSTVGISSLPSLPAGSNTIGAISNSSFGISGTLPAFASTPTFNIGTVPKATAAPTTSVASSATSVTLLALNANRKWASFRNDSTSVAYIAKSGTASTSSVYVLQPQGFLYFDDYTGVVSGIWASANGFMRIEEGT